MGIKVFTTTALVLMMLSSCAVLQATTADSSTWLYQQNGDLGANPDFTTSGFTDAGGGILDYTKSSGIVSATWITESDNLIANGYTIEFRVKVATSGGQNFGFGVMPADGAQLAWFAARAGDVMSQYPLTSWTGGVNTDDFHVFRMAHSPAATQFSIWRDGALLTSEASMYGPTYTEKFLNFGVISQDAGTGQFDYARWTVGVYAPPAVPEPSSLVALVTGLLGIGGLVLRKRG